jgi:hypothetical protein
MPALVQEPSLSALFQTEVPLLPLLPRLSDLGPVRQQHLLPPLTHSEVSLLNPVLSVSDQAQLPPLLQQPILSVPLRLLLLLLRLHLEVSALPLADLAMLPAPRQGSVIPLQPLLLLSVSARPTPHLQPRLLLPGSHSAELETVRLRLLLLPRSASVTQHLLRMEVLLPPVSPGDSDLEVLRLAQRRLLTVALVSVWSRVIHLVVPVEERSSLSGGARSVSSQ